MTEPLLAPGGDAASLEAERAVLGAILLHNEVLSEIEWLLPEHFFRVEHQRIYRRARELAVDHSAIDLTTLRVTLARAGDLERSGGPAYLAALVDGVPRGTNVKHYATIVRQNCIARGAFTASEHFQRDLSTDPGIIANGRGTAHLEQLQQFVDAAHGAGGDRRGRRLFRSAAELAAHVEERVTWLVAGLVAIGAITEISGKAKSAGKTTLNLFLAKCVLDADLCMGAMATQSAVVYLTEQPPTSFREALGRAGLLNRDDLSILCYADVAGYTWPAIVRLAEDEAARIGAKLIVVDTLPQFAGLRGDAENQSGEALAVLEPIQRSTARGFAWLLTRHDRKGVSEVGESGRGSGAFTAAVDIVLRLSRPDGNTRPTIRKLEGLSRFRETPACLLIEKISAHAPDPTVEVRAESILDTFVVLGDHEGIVAAETRAALLLALPESEGSALTEALALEAVHKPRPTVQRVLKALAAEGLVQRIGSGRKGNPFRFFKVSKDAVQTSTLEERFEQKEIGELL